MDIVTKGKIKKIQYHQQPSISLNDALLATTITLSKFTENSVMRQTSAFYTGFQSRNDSSDVLNFVTDAVKLWKPKSSDSYLLSNKSIKLSQQQYRHNKPNRNLENHCITCVTTLAPRVLQTTLFTLLQLIIGSPVLVNGCSTRSRYDQKRLSSSYRFAELNDCPEAYWGYCRNGGVCKMTTDISGRIVPICSCPIGFHGRQCELINDPNIYFSRQQGQMEMAAMSGAMVAIIFVILFLSFVLYFYRRYMKYAIQENDSLSAFDTLELSPPINKQKQDSHATINDLEKNEIVESKAEPSIRIKLAEKLDEPSNTFELFTLTEYPNVGFAQHRNLFIHYVRLHYLAMALLDLDNIDTRLEGNSMISIPHYRIKDGKYAVYVIKVAIDSAIWTTERRYSDFVAFDLQRFEDRKKSFLPPKKLVGNLDLEFLDERRIELEKYIRTVVELDLWLQRRRKQYALPSLIAHFLDFQEYDLLHSKGSHGITDLVIISLPLLLVDEDLGSTDGSMLFKVCRDIYLTQCFKDFINSLEYFICTFQEKTKFYITVGNNSIGSNSADIDSKKISNDVNWMP
ncbi:Nischarin [Dirofilaria immitis]